MTAPEPLDRMGVTVDDVMTAQRGRVLIGALDRMIHSAANYWVGLLSDLVCALAFLIIGLHQFSGRVAPGVAAAILGFLAWGFIEYAIHRWILHGPATPARRAHARHHADGTALISTPLLVVMAGASITWALVALVVPARLAALLVFGIYSGYNYFALLHHLQHHRERDLARFAYLRRSERLHHIHHDRHVVNYGITTTIWDRLLGTFEPVRLRSPRRGSATIWRYPRTSSGARPDRTG
jgi:sterol desaturase/sphingolipid hydroxylase (fatty acid hydroxylase superfamily)